MDIPGAGLVFKRIHKFSRLLNLFLSFLSFREQGKFSKELKTISIRCVPLGAPSQLTGYDNMSWV